MDPIGVYHADLSRLSTAACVLLLDPAEKHRASLFSNRRARHEFVTSRAMLRLLLSQHTGQPASTLKIETGPHGKPFLRDRNAHFSISHSGGLALIAISTAAVGVDIEHTCGDLDYMDAAAPVFSSPELDVLRRTEDARRADVFFTIWTRKEAYLKATGLGFSSDLRAISTVSPNGEIEDQSDRSDKRPWSVLDLRTPTGFKAALATASRSPRLEIAEFPGKALLPLLEEAAGGFADNC